jgi:hypothetical protein
MAVFIILEPAGAADSAFIHITPAAAAAVTIPDKVVFVIDFGARLTFQNITFKIKVF